VTTESAELEVLHDDLVRVVEKSHAGDQDAVLTRLQNAAENIGESWSGSWIGYHANVYYHAFHPPEPGDHFSVEWGLMNVTDSDAMTGWSERRPEEVRAAIFEVAGKPDISSYEDTARKVKQLVAEKREELLSLLQAAASHTEEDAFIARLRDEAKGLKAFSAQDFIKHQSPSGGVWSRDSTAVTQGIWTPPHIIVLAEVFAIRQPLESAEQLARIAKLASSHLKRVEKQHTREERTGTNVFIGHGRSTAWRELKDFVHDRLRLPWDEFNRVPVAGVTNISRLAEMLDAAAIAFLVMTAEDEQKDGTVRARENVVHEAGLFQGRLGFTRAIVILEEGCQEFSNIQGLGQIRFPQGRISAAFEEIRQVLEREGIIAIED
jgi:predicted nucleotide-binding protein